MEIRPEDVRRVAELARLELREDELARAAVELSAVLAYAAALGRLDLTDCAPLERPAAGSGLRADEAATPSLTAAEAVAMAPQSEGGFFLVPPVLESAEP